MPRQQTFRRKRKRKIKKFTRKIKKFTRKIKQRINRNKNRSMRNLTLFGGAPRKRGDPPSYYKVSTKRSSEFVVSEKYDPEFNIEKIPEEERITYPSKLEDVPDPPPVDWYDNMFYHDSSDDGGDPTSVLELKLPKDHSYSDHFKNARAAFEDGMKAFDEFAVWPRNDNKETFFDELYEIDVELRDNFYWRDEYDDNIRTQLAHNYGNAALERDKLIYKHLFRIQDIYNKLAKMFYIPDHEKFINLNIFRKLKAAENALALLNALRDIDHGELVNNFD